MQQILCFFIAIFLFATLFVSSTDVLVEKQYCRIAKQNLNLSGKEIVNYIVYNEGKVEFDEQGYLNSLDRITNKEEIIGGIFYYKKTIYLFKKGGAKKEVGIDTSFMNAANKRNTINNLLDYLLEKDEKKTVINMAVENEADYLTETLFNKLEENTVFIVEKMGKNVILSGFVVDVE